MNNQARIRAPANSPRHKRKLHTSFGSCIIIGAIDSVESLEARLLLSAHGSAAGSTTDGIGNQTAIALIDSTLPDQSLLAQSLPDVYRILYNPTRESANQVLDQAIQAAQSIGTSLQSIMVFSHGAAGEFALGGDLISLSTLSQTASQWKSLGAHIVAGGSFDIFSCDVVATANGQALLDRLHTLTSASVFGSTNITGHDGDWILEAHSAGAIAGSPLPIRENLLQFYPADLSIGVATPAAATPSPATGTTTDLSVLGTDTLGESALTYNWAATVQPAGSNPIFSDNSDNAAKDCTVTFDMAGDYTFEVTIDDGSLNTTSDVSVTVDQTLSSITVSPSSSPLNENGTQQFTATGHDQFGAAMTTPPTFTWSIASGVGSIDTNGLYTAPDGTGSATVQAANGSVSGTASVTVTNATPTVATPAGASFTTVTGTTTDLSVLGADDGGESALTYTWAATDQPVGSNPIFSDNDDNTAKASTVTFDTEGAYTFQVTISDGNSSVTSSVNVTVDQTLASITVSPASSPLNENQTQQFAAAGFDQFGAPMATPPTFTWSKTAGVGSIDASGLYTAPNGTGSATVQAANSSVNGTASVTIINATPTVATPAGASSTTVTGTSTNLSALGADDGGESNLTYTWAATTQPTGSNPIFSDNGDNAAKASTVTFDSAGAYTFQVTISDGNSSVTSSVNVTVNQTLTSITVSPSSPSLNENQTQQFSASGFDQFGTSMVTPPTFIWSKTAGVGGVNASGLYTAPNGTGAATVQAANGSVSGTASVTITNATPTVATPAGASATTVTGTTTNLSVLGADDGGESNLTYTWSATAKPGGANPLFGANGNNAAKSSTVTFDTAGSYIFQVSISDGNSSITSSVNVTVDQTLTSITVSPASSPLNENQTQQFSATGFDQFAASMVTPPTFTWSKTAGVGGINASGLYTAPNGTGSATVQAANGSVSGTASVTITNATPTVATPAGASATTVTGSATNLSVLGADDGGESNLTYSWAATAEPGGANPIFSANGNNAAKSSTVTFDTAGAYTFQVTISDGNSSVISSVNVTVNQTLTSITVSPTSSPLNENGMQQFAATGFDQFGTSMGTPPTFTWTKTMGVGSINASGLYTAPNGTGSATVQAANGSVSGMASVTVTNATPTVATPAGASATTVIDTTTNLSVLGADDGGEPALTYTWAATAKPGGSNPIFSDNGNNAAKASTVTFDTAGTYTFQVMISDGNSSVTSSVNVTVDQTLTSITVSPTSSPLNENGTQQFSAAGLDQFGASMVTPPTFTWTKTAGVGGINASGLYTAPNGTGSATVQAANGSVSGTASVTVTNATPTVATPAGASATTVTGTTTNLSVLGADDGGEAALTYTWAATAQPGGSNPIFSANGNNAAKASTVTFNAAGGYTFQVTISDGNSSVTSNVNVTVNQTLTSITVSPSNPTLNENQTQQFGATGFDQFGTSMVTPPTFTWSMASGVGSVDASGLYTAPGSAGSGTVKAANGSVNGTASVTVDNATPTVATPAGATPATVTGTTTGLSVLGADDGGEPNLTYTWSATTEPTGANPIFSTNNNNAAKSNTVTFDMAGAYTFQVTISDGNSSVTSSVNVTVDQTLTSITVSPSSSPLNENGTQQFSAAGFDQFGDSMTTPPTFTWSVPVGVGSVDTNGLYTAPNGTGSATVKAANGSVNGTASVTVTNATPTVATPAGASFTTVTGSTTNLSVLGADDGGEPNLTYTWSATTQPGGANPIFSANGNNGAKNSTVTFNAAGAYIFQVTISDGNSSVTSSANVTVDQTLTSITVNPASSPLNENGTQQFSAAGFDQFGTSMATPPTFTWSVTAGVGSVDTNGLYTAPDGTGSAMVQAASGSVSGTSSVAVTNATPTVATAAGASSTIVASTTTNLSVLGADDGGEPALIYTWSATTQPTGANPIFSANGNNAAKASTVTFNMAGGYTFQVVISDGNSSVTSSVNVTVNQTLNSITVSPASSPLNENQTQQFNAAGFDQFGASMATPPTFTWSVAVGIGSVNSSGLYTSPGSAGMATVQAANGLVTGTATVTVTNATPTVATVAGASSTTVIGTTTDLSVLGADDGGESNLTYTWVVVTGPTGANPIFSDNDDNAAKASTVTFDIAGAYTFQVTISDGNSGVTSSVNVTVNQALTSIAVSPSSPGLDENQTQQFSATAFDQFDIAMSSQPAFTWTKTAGVGSISNSGLYTAPYGTGTATVQAASGSVSGTAAVTVINAPPTIVTTAAASPTTVTAKSSNLTVLAADDGGQANLTYTWAATTKPAGATPTFGANGNNAAKSNTVAFNRAGSYTFTVTINDGTNSITSSVNVTVDQTLTSIFINQGNVTLHENASEQFTATGKDQFAVAMAIQPTFTWANSPSVGSINSTGRYTSPGFTGVTSVRATSGSVLGITFVTVINASPTVAVAASAASSTVIGTSVALSVLGADDGGESNLTYLWTVTAQPAGSSPIFSANGSNSAKATTVTFDRIGSYSFLVTITDAEGSAVTSSLTLTVVPTLSQILLTPTSQTMQVNQTQQFAATGQDQFGQLMDMPTTTWSLDPGSLGSVDSNGLFIAAATVGNVIIRATAAGQTATAALVVQNPPPIITVAPYVQSISTTDSTATLHVAGEGFENEVPLTYTWQIVSQPDYPKNVSGGLPGSSAPVTPLAVFSINGSNAAQNTTVTFLAAGSYTFSVTASDGTTSTTSTVRVASVAKAPAKQTTLVSGVTTIGTAQSLSGFIVMFNGPLDLAAQDIRGYRISSSAINHPVSITSAVYDSTTYTVTLMLSTAVPMRNLQGTLSVLGVGRHAIKDASGITIDGDANGHAGGTFFYKFATTESRSLTYTDKAGDIIHLALTGPGKIVSLISRTDDSPSIFLVGTDPATSILTGRFHKGGRKSQGYAVLDELSGTSMADIQLGSEFHIGVSNP